MDITTLAAWGRVPGRHRCRRFVDLLGLANPAELETVAGLDRLRDGADSVLAEFDDGAGPERGADLLGRHR